MRGSRSQRHRNATMRHAKKKTTDAFAIAINDDANATKPIPDQEKSSNKSPPRKANVRKALVPRTQTSNPRAIQPKQYGRRDSTTRRLNDHRVVATYVTSRAIAE